MHKHRRTTQNRQKGTLLCILFFLALLGAGLPASATHFRGGSLSWQQAGNDSIKFIMTTSWRRGYFINQGQSAKVGTAVTPGGTFNFGDASPVLGNSPLLALTVTSSDSVSDIVTTTYTVTHKYASSGIHTAVFSGCCRLSSLQQNNNDQSFILMTTANSGGPAYNNPPTSSLPPRINIPDNTISTFTIPATDPEGDSISFRLATGAESGLVTLAPTGFTLNPDGTFTMNTLNAVNPTIDTGKLYSVQIMLEDRDRTTKAVKSKTPVDILIRIVPFSNPPIFVKPTPFSPNNVYNVLPGDSVKFTVAAKDPDLGQFARLVPVALPLGATMNPTLPVTGPVNDTVRSSFRWIPTAGQVGNYVVNFVAQDTLGVQRITSVTINVLCALTTTTTVTPANCKGQSNGAITQTPSNFSSAGNLLYSWTNTGNTTVIASTKNLTGRPAGSYDLRINDVGTGCSKNITGIIIDNALTITPTPGSNSPVCSGNDLSFTGGGADSLTWTGPNGFSASGTPASIPNATTAATGTYILTATDKATGCQASATTVATVIAIPVVSITPAAATTFCEGGSVVLTASGADSYVWSTNATTTSINASASGNYTVTGTSNGCSASISQSVTVNPLPTVSVSTDGPTTFCNGNSVTLTASGASSYLWSNHASTDAITVTTTGNYTVTGTDGNGCSASAAATSVTVNENPSFTVSAVDPLCHSGATGSITITASNGAIPYHYSANGGSSYQDLNSFTGLAAATYAIGVKDQNGCTAALQNVSLSEPALLTAAAYTTADVSCNGGTNGAVSVNAGGGTAPYTYLWSNNAVSQSIGTLSAGMYNVTVTDDHGCTASAAATVTQPAVLTASATHTNVACNGGSNATVDLTVAGGTAPYGYAWSNAASTEDLSGLTAGTYNVMVTDGHGCTANAGATVTEPALLTVSGTATDALCNGAANGSVSITAAGGTSGYTYSWSNNTTAQNLSGVGAGTYTVTVTDAHNCTATGSYAVGQPAALVASAGGANVSCYGGSNGTASVSVTGGSPAYTYSWSNNATTQSLTGLAAGTYTVTVTDNHNCVATSSYTVTQPAMLAVSGITTGVSCFGGNNGAVNITATGGTAGYSYLWSNSATSEDLTGLSTGTYTVTVTDAHSCTAAGSFAVTQPTALSVTGAATPVSCFGGSNGTVSIMPSGGTAPYAYSWTPGGAATQNLTGKAAGTYTVTITDRNGCMKTASYTITQPSRLLVGAITASSTHTVTSCNAYTIYLGYGPQSFTLSVSPTGGTGAYSYAWTPSASVSSATSATTVVSPITGTFYNVTVTDANGCTSTTNTGAGSGFQIRVKDVRCGNGNDKVQVCHNGNAICISPSAVPAHLSNHGDCLGDCTNTFVRQTATTSHRVNLEEGSIVVFPNPAHGQVSIALKDMEAAYRSCQITDINGRVVMAKEFTGDVHADVVTLDVSNYAPGIYIIRAVTDGGATLSKFTVE